MVMTHLQFKNISPKKVQWCVKNRLGLRAVKTGKPPPHPSPHHHHTGSRDNNSPSEGQEATPHTTLKRGCPHRTFHHPCVAGVTLVCWGWNELCSSCHPPNTQRFKVHSDENNPEMTKCFTLRQRERDMMFSCISVFIVILFLIAS